jgi:hypothetical protein
MPPIKFLALACGVLALVLALPSVSHCQEPVKVTPCQLASDPPTYNQKLIEVTGFVSHGFEDSTIFDPACSSWPFIWLEYGGTVKSGTMYCCGVSNNRTRPNELEVEKIPVPLVSDDQFQEFDTLIQRKPDSIVHATIVGRFFAGKQIYYPKKTFWGGYGHMGCCSLLTIQQVLSVDPHNRLDVDYGAAPDQPKMNMGCVYRRLTETLTYSASIEDEKLADNGDRVWAFDEPQRVASDSLAQLLTIDETSIQGLKETLKTDGRFVYDWTSGDKRTSYMVVVSRPYWLSFYSADPKRVAWVVTAAYESSCGKHNHNKAIRLQ